MHIRTENLSYEYKIHNEAGDVEETFLALDQVDINIEKGSFVAVLGHNGSGKSTFAKHLNALLLPSKGSVFVKNMDTQKEKNLWDIRKGAGMVFQNPDNQIIATIVEEDVAFGPENLGVESKEIRKRVDEALLSVEMEEYARHSPNRLSGGQKQRVAIAGILAMHPECIILDEPTAMLDPSGRDEVLEAIKFLNQKEDMTIILITHYMEEAIDADYVFVMNKGKVEFSGTPREIFVRVDELKALGLDVPQTVEVAYELRKKGINIPLDLLDEKEMVDAICQLKSKN